MSGFTDSNVTGNLQGAVLDGGNNTTANAFVPPPAPTGANIAVWNMLCDGMSLSHPLVGTQFTFADHPTFTGPFTIDVAAESSTAQANPGRPQFLKGITFSAGKKNEWYCTVLPYIRLLTFIVASTTDTFFIGAMLKTLPDVINNIVKIDMNGFHWFSGVSDSRKSNPFMILASNLPSLRDMSFTVHTSALTGSMWGERQLLELERTNPDRAKERRVRTVAEVIDRYGMGQIFSSRALEHIRLVYIKSDMVTAFIVEGNPGLLLANLRNWLAQGFRDQGREVVVELSLAT
ncbi:hypothetical protein G6011_08512 [Alternaria panax]|uniref:Uncharacterized protein n=1 Tax=Alternaria panax TaxID=48097 RepID=A0AAD4I9Z4_9PLEO|nr:hypothetical protein G6011_08512 [Alternaria panax]